MKRVPLLLAAALVAATGLNVVLWSAFVDCSGHAGKLHGELEKTKADLRQARADALIFRDKPAAEVFAPHDWLPTAEDPALVEVPHG
jgi:hypothetical protein